MFEVPTAPRLNVFATFRLNMQVLGLLGKYLSEKRVTFPHTLHVQLESVSLREGPFFLSLLCMILKGKVEGQLKAHVFIGSKLGPADNRPCSKTVLLLSGSFPKESCMFRCCHLFIFQTSIARGESRCQTW